eukprot:CAMPEP_0178793078 /NCGR_PEP_ID=MMETSP0745-20121128/8876_1 /TAXON_ID=913974 /ORGANISM="Nitzschia punctata, Strain CCMP561" /LENGTH=67 /DNA_ID=CAMNT_0020451331 /DNA_START=121 /DNA_END=324 /DNA_ORIENTATION=+
MPLEDMHAQHSIWEAHHDHYFDENNPLNLSVRTKVWLFVIFVAVSFLCLGYVFWIVVEKERKEQKDK